MVTEQVNAKRFINWLENYNHQRGYDNLGEALLRWCTSDSGAEELNYEYPRLLRMVVAILMTQKEPFKVGRVVHQAEYTEFPLPSAYDGWLPTQEDFNLVVQKSKRQARKAERENTVRIKAMEKERAQFIREKHFKAS